MELVEVVVITKELYDRTKEALSKATHKEFDTCSNDTCELITKVLKELENVGG